MEMENENRNGKVRVEGGRPLTLLGLGEGFFCFV